MPRIEQADKERRNIEAGAPPERLSKDFIIFQQSQQIAELVEMLERVNGTAMGFWRGNSVFSEIQELINKHKDNE